MKNVAVEANVESKLEVSVVCPLYNEEGNVQELYERIYKSLRKIGKSFEIIFIDDGSIDATLEKCRELSPLKIIEFRRNFGQTAALDCGIKYSRGDVIITMDGDLQNDPGDFSRLLKKMNEGYDVVSGWRKYRKDSFSKKVISRGADFLRKFFIDDGVHDSGCTLKAYKKECFDETDLYGEMHRFIPAILKIQGFKIGEIVVKHNHRKWGHTKYGLSRTLKGFLDMISVWFWRKYSSRPLHLFGGWGLIFTFFGGALLIFLAFLKIFWNISLSDKIWPLISVFMILAGLQFFISGFLADIAIKSYYNDTRRNYVIRDVIDNKRE